VDSGNSDLEVVEIKQPTVKRSFSRGISFASLGVVYSVYIFFAIDCCLRWRRLWNSEISVVVDQVSGDGVSLVAPLGRKRICQKDWTCGML
jgi:hypothetical protein